MSYIAQIVAESTPRSTEAIPTTFIEPHHASEAARILFASSPRHGKRFALVMHRRVARGLDTDLIEHWARVVMAISRMG